MAVDKQDGAGAAGGTVGTKTGAGGHPQGYDAHGHYTGPAGGAVDLISGAVKVYAGSGKLAGADSEAGRKEPKSLLSATSEELEKIAEGTGQALRQGAAGAREALSRTAEELATNEDLHKGLEFGLRAAGEVSKDVAESVMLDTGLNAWDTIGAEIVERAGWEGVAKALSNPAVTLPLNKAISMKRMIDSVWGGGHEQDTRELGSRIDNVYERVYERKR